MQKVNVVKECKVAANGNSLTIQHLPGFENGTFSCDPITVLIVKPGCRCNLSKTVSYSLFLLHELLVTFCNCQHFPQNSQKNTIASLL